MICPYMPCNYVMKTLKDPDNDKVLYKTKEYKPSKCVKDKCPFYSDGEDDFTPETCIRAEKEKEQ